MHKCNTLKSCFTTCKTLSEGALGHFLLCLHINSILVMCCIFIVCYEKNIYICVRKY